MLDIRLRHWQAVWLMLVVTMMWSIAGVVTRHLEHARSFEITFWRSFFTMVSLAVLLPLFQGWACGANSPPAAPRSGCRVCAGA